MRRAVAFAKSIAASKQIEKHFSDVVNQYVLSDVTDTVLRCDVRHVDGTFNALVRNERLDWLRAALPSDSRTCRILTNAKCLSEGVDVPDLDAVLFLHPRNSIVDVVQSVGRVMRRRGGQGVRLRHPAHRHPGQHDPEAALADNKKYRVVWQVLQALRAHDDRFNAMVNKIELNRARDDRTQVIGVGSYDSNADSGGQTVLPFPQLAEWRDAIYAKMVQKVGDRRYWETWAQDVAAIAERNTARIRALLGDETSDVAPPLRRVRRGAARNPQRQHHVRGRHQHAVAAPHHPPGVRGPLRGLLFRREQSRLDRNTGDGGCPRRPERGRRDGDPRPLLLTASDNEPPA